MCLCVCVCVSVSVSVCVYQCLCLFPDAAGRQFATARLLTPFHSATFQTAAPKQIPTVSSKARSFDRNLQKSPTVTTVTTVQTSLHSPSSSRIPSSISVWSTLTPATNSNFDNSEGPAPLPGRIYSINPDLLNMTERSECCHL